VTGPRPEVSVVVPVRDGARVLPALLEALRGQTLPSHAFEVIVVDNGSRDGTAAVARRDGADTIVEDAVPNRGRARNLGVARARASLIAFTDADCVPEAGWLEALVGCAAGREPLTAGPVLVRTHEPPNGIERFERLWRFGQEAWVAQGWAATANLAVEREAFDRIGGFDPGYRHIGEDVDFCLRAGRHGLALGWCADAVVHHDADDRLWPLLKRSYRHGYGTHQVYERLGAGYRAWRRPHWLVGDRPLALLGRRRGDLAEGEWKRMRRLARAGYAARIAGSLAADARRLAR
jgi:GT2 family glycosyltransferase